MPITRCRRSIWICTRSSNASNKPSWESPSPPTPSTATRLIPIRCWAAFNGVLGVTRTSINTTHQSLLGLNTSVNYTHQIQHWTVAGGFSYSQDTQTVLIAYTTSGYNYFGSVGRRIGRRSYWGAYVSGARSLLTDEPGSANSSQSYSTSLSMSRFSASMAPTRSPAGMRF